MRIIDTRMIPIEWIQADLFNTENYFFNRICFSPFLGKDFEVSFYVNDETRIKRIIS